MALEGDEDISDVIERSGEKQARRSANKVIRESERNCSRNSPAVGAVKKPKKCTAVSAAASASPTDDFESGKGKRKRVGKPMSVTPSALDEDMDDAMRENVSYFPLLL